MSTDTPRINAACGVPGENWEKVAVRLCDEGIKLELELADALEQLGNLRNIHREVCREKAMMRETIDDLTQMKSNLIRDSILDVSKIRRLRTALQQIASFVDRNSPVHATASIALMATEDAIDGTGKAETSE